MELTSIDYDIIEYIDKANEVHISNILSEFPDDTHSTLYRIKLLSEKEKHHSGYYSLDNTSYIELNFEYITDEHHLTHSVPIDTYSITELGKTALTEYKKLCLNQADQKQLELERHNREKETVKIAKSSKNWAILATIISLCALLKSYDQQLYAVIKWLMQLWK